VAASLGLKTYGFFDFNMQPIVKLRLPDVGVDLEWSTSTLLDLRAKSGLNSIECTLERAVFC